MTKSGSPSRPQILQWIRDQLANGGHIAPTVHARSRMATRKIDMNDVLRVIKSGWITEYGPNERGNNQATIDGLDLDGRRLQVILVIEQDAPREGDSTLLIRTVIDLSTRKK